MSASAWLGLVSALIAWFSAFTVAVVAAYLSARNNRRLEAEKQRATQAAAAISDLYTGLMRYTRYWELVTKHRAQPEQPSGLVDGWREKALEGEIAVVGARIRLTTYGNDEVVATMVDWVKRGATLADPDSRRDLARVVIEVRRDIFRAAGPQATTVSITEDDVSSMIFRKNESSDQLPTDNSAAVLSATHLELVGAISRHSS